MVYLKTRCCIYEKQAKTLKSAYSADLIDLSDLQIKIPMIT